MQHTSIILATTKHELDQQGTDNAYTINKTKKSNQILLGKVLIWYYVPESVDLLEIKHAANM